VHPGYNRGMKKAKAMLIIGIWVIILPHLGFSYNVKNILFLITGSALIYIAFVIYNQHKREQPKDSAFENFTENNVEEHKEHEEENHESEG